VLVISSVLGLLGVIQSFGLLYLGDTLHHLDRAQLQTMMFLQLVAGGHLILFVTRTRGVLWKPPYSSSKLFFAIVATQIVSQESMTIRRRQLRNPNHLGCTASMLSPSYVSATM
jgi:H+-transporting ATPase